MKNIIKLTAILLLSIFFFFSTSQTVDTTFNKKLVKDLNLQLGRVQAGFIMSGLTIGFGSMINLIAINKNEPNASEYTDIKLYEKDLEDFNSNQKSLKTTSAVLIGGGGIGLLITGLSIKRIMDKKESAKKLSVTPQLNGLKLAYRF